MATVTVNGKTHEVEAGSLWNLVQEGANRFGSINHPTELSIRGDELATFITDAINHPTEHYLVEGTGLYTHYVSETLWEASKWSSALCGTIGKLWSRVEKASKDVCHDCKTLHEKIEGWETKNGL